MTPDDQLGHGDKLNGSSMIRYTEHNHPELIEQPNGLQRVEHDMKCQEEERCFQEPDKINENDMLLDQSDLSLKDRYGKPKHHGTIWEPPVVYINTELTTAKASNQVKPTESPMVEHRFHEHSRSANSSPKSQKVGCHCCHSEPMPHFRSQSDAISRHHSASSNHHVPFEAECRQDVFYVPLENEEHISQYHLRQSCNCSSCQKGRIDGLQTHSTHSPHPKELRREGGGHDSLKSLLPDLATRPVSFFCI